MKKIPRISQSKSMDEEIVYKSLSYAHKENQTENEFHHVQLFPDMKTTYNKRRIVIIAIPYNAKEIK